MKPPPPPPLPTLQHPPSWLNNAGNLDRSACFEIRLKEVRQLAGCVCVRKAARLRGSHRVRDTRVNVRPLPDEKPASNGLGRVATGVYELTVYDLETMASFRVPRAMAGDHRSARANAMRHPRRAREIAERMGGCGDGRIRDARGKPRWKSNVRGIPRDQRDQPIPEERLHVNIWTNELGPGKVLGLPRDWTQPVRLEKWVYGEKMTHNETPTELGRRGALPKYYLVCPGVLPDNRAKAAKAAMRQRGRKMLERIDLAAGHPMALVRPRGSREDPRLAPLSDAPRGPKPKGCPQRVLKLMLPMCWPEEYEDAMNAQRWLASLTIHQQTVAAETVAKLTWRYGILFAPRTMLCRQCLQVRHGNHPETARLGERRRRRPERYMPISKKQRKRGKVA